MWLEMYKTNFRMEDTQLGRFCQIDPMGEIFVDLSLYSDSFENPNIDDNPV